MPKGDFSMPYTCRECIGYTMLTAENQNLRWELQGLKDQITALRKEISHDTRSFQLERVNRPGYPALHPSQETGHENFKNGSKWPGPIERSEEGDDCVQIPSTDD